MKSAVKNNPLRILLLAPHPFYQERGTPIACKLMIESLCAAGHKVELLTYAAGDDVEIDGLTLRRVQKLRFPFSIFNFLLRDVPIGLSVKKLFCDALMAWELIKLWVIKGERYDVIHAGEEAVFLAFFLGFLHDRPGPIVYDMDSSLADQVVEKFPQLSPIAWFLDQMERIAFRQTSLTLPVCEALAVKLKSAVSKANYEILEDVYFEPEEENEETEELGSRSKELVADGLAPAPTNGAGDPLLMLYVGNLESYQGIDLLLESLHVLHSEMAPKEGSKETRPWIVKLIGGIPNDIEKYQAKIKLLGLEQAVFLLGPRPLKLLPKLLKQADILLSPRTKGGNTPMKLYSYLASGVPIVATRIRSHTQAVDDSTAILVEPNETSMATGIAKLLMDTGSELRAEIGTAGRKLALERFSIKTYREKLFRSYAKLSSITESLEVRS